MNKSSHTLFLYTLDSPFSYCVAYPICFENLQGSIFWPPIIFRVSKKNCLILLKENESFFSLYNFHIQKLTWLKFLPIFRAFPFPSTIWSLFCKTLTPVQILGCRQDLVHMVYSTMLTTILHILTTSASNIYIIIQFIFYT